MTATRIPSCLAAALIIENRNTHGRLLAKLKAVQNPKYMDLLAICLIERESA